MPKRYFEDFEVGDAAESIGRTVSEHDVYAFAGLTGSYGEIHTNKAFMAESAYGHRLVQGVLLLTYLNGFTTMLEWDPDIVALYGLDRVRFLNAVRIGDTVHLEIELEETEERGEDAGLLTFDADLVTEAGDVALTCDWKLLVHRRPDGT